MNTNHTNDEVAIHPAASIKRTNRIAAALLVLMGGFAIAPGATAMAESKKKGHEDKGGWKTAQLTTYTSYPRCCKGSPAYDPHADKGECEDYSGCKYEGEFAAIGHKSFEWVKDNAIIAFYDNSDKAGREFNKKYGGKKVKLRKNGKEFTAVIADTCGNKDCDNCCTKNSKGGFLVDMEYWTAQKHLGGANKAEGTIEFQIVD
ncbi:MAG TPA: hypothetical protein VF469_09240 [Kofleriaceae bacterium]